MEQTKENNGITLVALTITIIILLIIGGAASYAGIDNINKVKNQLLITEMEQVKHFVGESYNNYLKTKNEAFLVGTEVSDSTVSNLIAPVTIVTIPEEYYEAGVKKSVAKFYEISPSNLEKIGMENSPNTYIVNYLTGEVVNATQTRTSSGDLLYTYIRSIFNNNDITAF